MQSNTLPLLNHISLAFEFFDLDEICDPHKTSDPPEECKRREMHDPCEIGYPLEIYTNSEYLTHVKYMTSVNYANGV